MSCKDKLDMIYSILAPDYEPEDVSGEEPEANGLVNIEGVGNDQA